jgi:threonine dehydrogenase-like Zn-dependent dehydrogenase
MAAYSATIQGASEVYVVDRVKERLDKAQQIGCIPIDFSKGDAVDQILKLRGGYGHVFYMNPKDDVLHDLPQT